MAIATVRAFLNAGEVRCETPAIRHDCDASRGFGPSASKQARRMVGPGRQRQNSALSRSLSASTLPKSVISSNGGPVSPSLTFQDGPGEGRVSR